MIHLTEVANCWSGSSLCTQSEMRTRKTSTRVEVSTPSQPLLPKDERVNGVVKPYKAVHLDTDSATYDDDQLRPSYGRKSIPLTMERSPRDLAIALAVFLLSATVRFWRLDHPSAVV